MSKSDNAGPQILDHEYDGIQEYDNPLPGWWSLIFYGTIVFAIGYAVVFHILAWPKNRDEAYKAAKVAYAASHEDDNAVASASEDTLASGSKDATTVEHGKEIFQSKCATCHTPDGHGLIGPNLTDLYQIHGTTRVDLFSTIRDGAPGTAMMAWGPQLPANDLVSVASFVVSLRGKNVPGKEPQGTKVEPFK